MVIRAEMALTGLENGLYGVMVGMHRSDGGIGRCFVTISAGCAGTLLVVIPARPSWPD